MRKVKKLSICVIYPFSPIEYWLCRATTRTAWCWRWRTSRPSTRQTELRCLLPAVRTGGRSSPPPSSGRTGCTSWRWRAAAPAPRTAGSPSHQTAASAGSGSSDTRTNDFLFIKQRQIHKLICFVRLLGTHSNSRFTTFCQNSYFTR